ncbi:10801_t:CDS:1, partial [Gigaspora rosea]
AANKGENGSQKNFFPNILRCNISEDLSKKSILILTEALTIDYSNLKMQQQIQSFLEDYFEKPEESNIERSKNDESSTPRGNGTTPPRRKTECRKGT